MGINISNLHQHNHNPDRTFEACWRVCELELFSDSSGILALGQVSFLCALLKAGANNYESLCNHRREPKFDFKHLFTVKRLWNQNTCIILRIQMYCTHMHHVRYRYREVLIFMKDSWTDHTWVAFFFVLEGSVRIGWILTCGSGNSNDSKQLRGEWWGRRNLAMHFTAIFQRYFIEEEMCEQNGFLGMFVGWWRLVRVVFFFPSLMVH